MTKFVLIVEDDPKRIRWFGEALKGLTLVFAEDATSAIKALSCAQKGDVVHIFLDHDLGGDIFVCSSGQNTGASVARWLAAEGVSRFVKTPVTIHSMNPHGAQNIKHTLAAAGFQPSIVPFSALSERLTLQ